jgi:hypothetical protein
MVAIAQKNRGRVIPADGTLWDPALLGSALIYTSGSARASDENSPCRMVKAARDARLSVALTQHSNRVSTNAGLRRRETQFSRAETKTPKRPLQFSGQIAETKCVHERPPVRGYSH